jgi:hypothetical protein
MVSNEFSLKQLSSLALKAVPNVVLDLCWKIQ